MLLKNDTKSYQVKLAQYTRDGELVDIKGAKQDRLHHYRRLTFNIQLQTMEQAFPIAYSIFEFDDWKSIVHDFFNNHNPKTPQIWKLPFEFYEFVRDNNYAEKFNFPFINDLLLFEWIEIEIHTMEDIEFPHFESKGNLWNDTIILNPEFRLDKFEYPIHKVKPLEIKESDKGNYFILTYRKKETGAVQFLELSVLHTFAFEKINAESKSLKSISEEAIEIFGKENEEFIAKSLSDFGNLLFDKKIALGFKSEL